jgi:cytoplasmic iron level regulating protein YaaA (DUF328/UPF0246 family)
VTGSLFVLLPPSEGKEAGGSRAVKIGAFDGTLGSSRLEVVGALARVLESDDETILIRTLGVRGPLLERALAATRSVVEGRAPVLPAYQRYSGVVWSHLDPASISEATRRRILVPSGLYGLSAGTDLVADFRLKMNVNLAPLGNIARYWRPLVTEAICGYVRRATVVNLLPKEHTAAIDFEMLGAVCDVIDVSFVSHDGTRAVGHDAKAVKGLVAREVLTKGEGSIASFRWEGWKACVRGERIEVVAPK